LFVGDYNHSKSSNQRQVQGVALRSGSWVCSWEITIKSTLSSHPQPSAKAPVIDKLLPPSIRFSAAAESNSAVRNTGKTPTRTTANRPGPQLLLLLLLLLTMPEYPFLH
jgi:hypothetical protein